MGAITTAINRIAIINLAASRILKNTATASPGPLRSKKGDRARDGAPTDGFNLGQLELPSLEL